MTIELSGNEFVTTASEELPPIGNQPGLDTLQYRVGTQASFKAAIVEGLANSDALRNLAHAQNDDPTMALADVWAGTLDVLTFYQERIANEGYLRTATERLSTQELGREVGYRLNPGIAAQTWLAFTVDDGPGRPESVTVDVGTRVQSVPDPGETSQTFETIEKIEARPEWNLLIPALTTEVTFTRKTSQVYLSGTSTHLQPGDAILIVGDERTQNAQMDPDKERWDFRVLTDVVPDPQNGRTLVKWEGGMGRGSVQPAQKGVQVLAFRQRAALFGHNAPDPNLFAVPDTLAGKLFSNDPSTGLRQWQNFWIQNGVIELDAPYPKILPGSWLALKRSSRGASDRGYVELYRALAVSFPTRSAFGLSAQVTQVIPDTQEHRPNNFFDLRDTVVFAQSEPLAAAAPPRTDPVEGTYIDLDRETTPLAEGRTIVVSGQLSNASEDAPNATVAVTLASGSTGARLELSSSLPPFDRATVTIAANVARGTHGETRREVLGSTDASQSFEAFPLRQSPLTFTPAPTPTGGASTLEVNISGVLWDEVETLYSRGPRDRVFTATPALDGTVSVQFGDGLSGARPPSGAENINASYRVGLGAAGNLKPGQIRLLLTRPLGVRGVTNPLPATGGTDAEGADDARQNVPFRVLTLDRIVSLHDYEDFARAFGGVLKARADWLWNGLCGVVFLTLTTASGDRLDADTYARLCAAIDGARDLAQALEVRAVEARQFGIHARLVLDPDCARPEDVAAAAAERLNGAFTLSRREFGQDVTESEILGLLQSVQGIAGAALTEPYPGEDSGRDWEASGRRIQAATARLDSTASPPAIEPPEIWVLPGQNAVRLQVVADLAQGKATS